MKKYIHLSFKTYINEVIRKYEKEHGTLKKMTSPISDIIHPEMDISVFSDFDHDHDKKTGRSITGIFGLVGSTPNVWKSKRQPTVQMSTFGAGFMALRTAMEDSVRICYYLRSMGVKVSKPSAIYVDNEGVFLNSVNPSSSLNKKFLALSYNFA